MNSTTIPQGHQHQHQQQQPQWANPDATSWSSSSTEEIHSHHHEQMQIAEDGLSFLNQPYSTLDEPVVETIMRDLNSVASKMKVVLLPLNKAVSIRSITVQ